MRRTEDAHIDRAVAYSSRSGDRTSLWLLTAVRLDDEDRTTSLHAFDAHPPVKRAAADDQGARFRAATAASEVALSDASPTRYQWSQAASNALSTARAVTRASSASTPLATSCSASRVAASRAWMCACPATD